MGDAQPGPGLAARAVLQRWVLIAWLTTLWMLLWQDLSVASVGGGVVVAVVVTRVSRSSPSGRTVVRPFACARLVCYFLGQLVVSTVVVARSVLAPRRFVHPDFVAVDLHVTSPALLAVIASAITATPGTLTVEATLDPPKAVVHVLDGRDPDRVRANIARLEALVTRAFGRPLAGTNRQR